MNTRMGTALGAALRRMRELGLASGEPPGADPE